LIFDCYEIDTVLVKTISRFARNTVDLLETVSRLKGLGIEIIFQQENLRTSEAEDDILITAISAIAQAESESMSEAIKWGLSMIEYAGLGVAVENAFPSVKEKADFITYSNNDEGVAYVLERFVLEGRQ